MRRFALLLLALAVLGASVSGQVYDRPLTEQDLERLVPVLRAEVALNQQQAREAAEHASIERARSAARAKAVADVAAGGNALTWLQQRTPHAVAPSIAAYQDACSLALTQSSGVPSAVLSFGIPAPPAWLALWKQRDPALPISTAQALPGRSRNAGARSEAVVQQARTFYSQEKFEYQGERAPFEWQFLAPDRLVSAIVMGVNVLGRDEACKQMPSGPVIVLRAEGEMFGKEPPSTGADVRRAFQAAIEKAGLREQDYLNLKLQLLAARKDAASGEPPAQNVETPPTPERRQEMAIRRQNVELYRRHAAELDPLLSKLRA